MGDAVADGTDFFEIFYHAHLGVNQSVQHNLDTRRVVGDGQLLIVFLSVVLMGEFAHFQTDALKQTLGHHLSVIGHVNQLIFD